MNRVIAGIQAGVVTLIFILLVAFGHIPLAAAGWAVLLGGLSAAVIYVTGGGSAVSIGIIVIVIGLVCMGIYMASGGKTLAIALVAGVILSFSWSIAITSPHPPPRSRLLFR